jgi:hypothetical protein
LLVRPVSVAAIRLPIWPGAVSPLALVAPVLIAAIAILLAASLRAVMADRAANCGAKQAVVPDDMAGNAVRACHKTTASCCGFMV